MSNNQRIAIVTGANRGIGREVSRQLAEKGYVTYLTARTIAKAQRAVAALGHPNLIAGELDVSSAESIATFYQRIRRKVNHVDALINNAAINYDTWQHVTNADPDAARDTMETNVFGAWRMCQTFLPLLRKSNHPRIVNVSSGSGTISDIDPSSPVYSMTKAALNAVTFMFAKELRRDRILVNAVCPGWVATDMGGNTGRPIPDGARGIVWAATLPDDGPTGGFFRDGEPLPL